MRRALTVAAVAMLASNASAEPLTRTQKAKIELLKRGSERASTEGNFAEAVAQLTLALQIAPENPELLLSLARAFDEWGNHCSEALEQITKFFAACGDNCALRDRGLSEEGLIANRCASDVTFETDPPGAIVQIAGEEYARVAPFTMQMKAGAYAVDVRRHGYLPRRIELAVEPATPQKAPISLEIDPVLSAKAPTEPPKVVLTPKIQAKRPTSIPTYAALATATAGGIAGVLFTMTSIDKVDEERRARFAGAPEAEVNSLRSSAKTNAALAYTGFGISLVGFAAAVALDYLIE